MKSAKCLCLLIGVSVVHRSSFAALAPWSGSNATVAYGTESDEDEKESVTLYRTVRQENIRREALTVILRAESIVRMNWFLDSLKQSPGWSLWMSGQSVGKPPIFQKQARPATGVC